HKIEIRIPEAESPLSIESFVVIEMVAPIAASVADPPQSDRYIGSRTTSIERSLLQIGTEIAAVQSQSLPDVGESDQIVSSEVDSKVRQIIQADLNHASAQTSDRKLGKS